MRRLAPLLLLTFLSACSLGGDGGGCVRVHQGEYEFPLKQVVQESIKVRVSQQGIGLLASKAKELLQTFFETDENGHAIIPLDELGVGELTTDVGPFDGSVRNLRLTLDLNGLDVEVIEGAYPPRLRILVKDAEVGLLEGELFSAADAGFFEGDVACVLANGPSGKVALLSFEMVFDLDISADGTLDLAVDSLDVDLQDIDLVVETDCSLSECLDGEIPPSTAECSECEALCETADLVASLSSQFQGVFNELIDQLISVLGAELSNVLADTLFNGKPFAVEGTLDVATLFGSLIHYLKGAEGLGILVRPSGDGFKSVSDPLGVEITLDSGVAANGVHECAKGELGSVVFESGPAPAFPAVAEGAEGEAQSYELGFALSEATVNQTLWSAWQSGVLCLDLSSTDLLNVTSGELDLRARHLELVFPGLGTLVDADSRVRIRIHPSFDSNAPPSVSFGSGQAKESTLTLPLPNLNLAIDVLEHGHAVQLIRFEAGVTVGMSLEMLGGGKLGLRVDTVTVDNISSTNNTLFEHADLDLIVELALDLGVTILEKTLEPVEIDAGSLLSGLLGNNLELTVLQASELKESGWLTVLMGLTDTSLEGPTSPMVQAKVLGLGKLHVEPDSMDPVQYRVDGGRWSRPYKGAVEFRHPRLWLVGEHRIEARRHGFAGNHSQPVEVIRFRTTADKPLIKPATIAAQEEAGCSMHRPSPPLWVLFICCLVFFRRRMFRWGLVVVTALVWGGVAGCADTRLAEPSPCVTNDQCPTGFLCGGEGLCVSSTPCAADTECCPGAICFNGWCRPVQECTDTCEALDEVCQGGRCVPTTCSVDGDCSAWSDCVGGRCLRGLPCDGECGPDQACHLDTSRCVDSPNCPSVCPMGTFRSVAETVEIDALSCADQAIPCMCLQAPQMPYPTPGIDGALTVTDGGFGVISYDDTYGDLVHSQFLQSDLSRVDQALDGVPQGPQLYAEDGYRGGVAASGPNVGGNPSVWTTKNAQGLELLNVMYRDVDLRTLRYMRFDPKAGKVSSRFDLPIEGEVGEFFCLTENPDSGRLVGLVYVERSADLSASQLVRLESLSEQPTDASDWVTEVLLERTLPLQKKAPCEGACGFTELCVLEDASESCVSALDSPECDAPCPAHTLCAKSSGSEQASCLPRVYFEGQPERVGTGLFVSCDAHQSAMAASWYDADLGTLVASLGAPLGSAPKVVDGSLIANDAPDVGLHSQVSVDALGDVAIAYQTRVSQDLRLASWKAQSWSLETVVDGEGLGSQPGGWTSVVTHEGITMLVEFNGATGIVSVHARHPDGCWARSSIWNQGETTYPDAAILGSGQLLVSGRSIAFTDTFQGMHEPVLKIVDIPLCAESADSD